MEQNPFKGWSQELFHRAIKQSENFLECAIQCKELALEVGDKAYAADQEWEEARQENRLFILRKAAKQARNNQHRREKHAALTSLGLVRVKGALGGVYYE